MITNDESKEYIDKIMEKINLTSNCNFEMKLISLDSILDKSHSNICPTFKASEVIYLAQFSTMF